MLYIYLKSGDEHNQQNKNLALLSIWAVKSPRMDGSSAQRAVIPK